MIFETSSTVYSKEVQAGFHLIIEIYHHHFTAKISITNYITVTFEKSHMEDGCDLYGYYFEYDTGEEILEYVDFFK